MSHAVLRSVFLSDEEDAAVREISMVLGISKSEVIRQCIREWLPIARENDRIIRDLMIAGRHLYPDK